MMKFVIEKLVDKRAWKLLIHFPATWHTFHPKSQGSVGSLTHFSEPLSFFLKEISLFLSLPVGSVSQPSLCLPHSPKILHTLFSAWKFLHTSHSPWCPPHPIPHPIHLIPPIGTSWSQATSSARSSANFGHTLPLRRLSSFTLRAARAVPSQHVSLIVARGSCVSVINAHFLLLSVRYMRAENNSMFSHLMLRPNILSISSAISSTISYLTGFMENKNILKMSIVIITFSDYQKPLDTTLNSAYNQ